jgi:PAS domain S-box-containing protein
MRSPRKTPKDDSLRRRAERLLPRKPEAASGIPPKDVKKVIHELQVHEVELEMQNNELRRAQEEIEASRSKYSDLYDFAPVGYVTLTGTGRIKEINLTGANLLGIERGRVVGNAFSGFLAPESRAVFREHCGAATQTPDRVCCEVKLVMKNGIPFYASIESVSVPNDRHRSIRSAIIDITDRKRAEEEVLKVNAKLEEKVRELEREVSQRKQAEEASKESEKRLHALSFQLLATQEAERRRVARELHDSIGQSLAAIRFALERKIGQMEKGNKPAGFSLEDILNMVQNSVAENQRITMNLRPPTLDDFGIVPTLNWFVRELQKTYPHLRIDKQIDLEEKDVADPLKAVIFRVCQEAANNFIRHSGGDLLSLQLNKVDKTIKLVIQDNGRGFDPASTPKGLGLASMEERVKLSGGTFEIKSTKGKGTRIQSAWPIG